VRATALGALERLGQLDDTGLVAAFADPDPGVRRRAAGIAARHRGVDLRPLLADADPAVVEVAAWACGEHEAVTDEILTVLLTLATGGGVGHDPLVRESAVAALGAIGDDRGLDAILAATADRPAVRRRAVLALAPFLAPDHPRAGEVAEALSRALTDRDWQVRQAAEDLTIPEEP
jgi:HEAT repeat protein